MRLFACGLLLTWAAYAAGSLHVQERVQSRDEIRGAAVSRDGRLFTWGQGLHVRSKDLKGAKTLASGDFGEGGCLVDLDGDGHEEFVGKEGKGLGRLALRKPPNWAPEIIDTQFDTHDCMEATLFGRKGILVIQRYMQVRFYEREGEGWKQREIYSIYTPSQQTGLSMKDIDGDGRVDIVCGNYWIQSPERFDLPWHVFAINTWFEDPESAMLAHKFVGGELLVTQAHVPNARVALFRKPKDPRLLWEEARLKGDFQHVHAVAVWQGVAYFGENNGPGSRLFAVRAGSAHAVGTAGSGFLRLFPMRDELISLGRTEIVRWTAAERQTR